MDEGTAAPTQNGPGRPEGPAGWRGWQLTTLLRAVRGRTVPAPPRAGRVAPRSPERARSRTSSGPDAQGAAPDPARGLDRVRRAQVLAPLDVAPGGTVRWGTATACQVDATTCGAAVLAMLAAAGDPALAGWLVTGRVAAGSVRPPELALLGTDDPGEVGGSGGSSGIGGVAPAAGSVPVGDDPDAPDWFRDPDGRSVHRAATPADATAARWAALQHALHRESTRRAVAGVLPWPRTLGTPPWGAARTARFPGVRYRAVLVDDTRTDEVRDLLARVDDTLDHGVPVPLYSGGDLGDGPSAAMPRHVVLVTARTADGYLVYEPGAGRVLPLARAAVLHAVGPQAALGRWTHVAGAILPVR